MTEPLWNHSDHGGATAVYAVQAPQWHRASGVTGVLETFLGLKKNFGKNFTHQTLELYLAKLSPSEFLDKLKILSWALDDRRALRLPGVATSYDVRAVTHRALYVRYVGDMEMWQRRMCRRGGAGTPQGGAHTPHGGRTVEDWLWGEVDNQRRILVEVRWQRFPHVYNIQWCLWGTSVI